MVAGQATRVDGMKKILLIALIILALLAVIAVLGRQYARSILYQPSRAEVAPTLPEIDTLRLHTPDGQTLVAWHHAPQPGQPIFLYFDGNGGSPEMWESTRWPAIIAHGAGFLAVYYRGYSGSTGSPTEPGLRIDARTGYDWLINHGYAPQDIVIHGFSLGSSVAVQLAAEAPARALILEAPMTGVGDIAVAHGPGLLPGLVRHLYQSRDYIPRVHYPVLIAHGDADQVIPFAHGEAMFALANAPKQFVPIHGGAHADLPARGLYAHVWSFLDSHPAE